MPPLDAEQEVWRRVRERGRITVAEFMEVALYWPYGGYYTRPGRVGAEGDFATAPHVHPAFGAALAIQCFQAWTLLDRPAPFWVVEIGAGDGTLCRDFTAYAQHLPDGFTEAMRYVCIDRSLLPGKEREVSSVPVLRVTATGVPLRPFAGCVISNELMDAMPVHVVEGWEGGLREMYVTETVAPGPDGTRPRLAGTLAEPSTTELAERLAAVGVRLAPGQRAEVCLGRGTWVAQVAFAMERGLVLTIDYGDTAERLYTKDRPLGTLTAYYQHVQIPNVYQRPGRQDLTAQVDFSSLEREGAARGLAALGFTTQGEFLERLGARRWSDAILVHMRASARPSKADSYNCDALAALVDSDTMGGFKVLAQGKHLPAQPLWGFADTPGLGPDELLAQLPVPLLTPQRLPQPSAGGTMFELPGLPDTFP